MNWAAVLGRIAFPHHVSVRYRNEHTMRSSDLILRSHPTATYKLSVLLCHHNAPASFKWPSRRPIRPKTTTNNIWSVNNHIRKRCLGVSQLVKNEYVLISCQSCGVDNQLTLDKRLINACKVLKNIAFNSHTL